MTAKTTSSDLQVVESKSTCVDYNPEKKTLNWHHFDCEPEADFVFIVKVNFLTDYVTATQQQNTEKSQLL